MNLRTNSSRNYKNSSRDSCLQVLKEQLFEKSDNSFKTVVNSTFSKLNIASVRHMSSIPIQYELQNETFMIPSHIRAKEEMKFDSLCLKKTTAANIFKTTKPSSVSKQNLESLKLYDEQMLAGTDSKFNYAKKTQNQEKITQISTSKGSTYNILNEGPDCEYSKQLVQIG